VACRQGNVLTKTCHHSGLATALHDACLHAAKGVMENPNKDMVGGHPVIFTILWTETHVSQDAENSDGIVST
jgi:hypothetical protein